MRSLLYIFFLLVTNVSLGQVTNVKMAKQIPDLSIYNINGDTNNLKNVSSGKVTFIDFWFVPCAPCFAEMKMLHNLQVKYIDNDHFNFVTITLTDSAFVRPLLENRNTANNETYSYFVSMAGMDTFSLPVYFISNVASRQKRFIKYKNGFTGDGEGPLKGSANFPNNIFGFSGYPTILIYNKQGKLIYNKTGFTKANEQILQKQIEAVIENALRTL